MKTIRILLILLGVGFFALGASTTNGRAEGCGPWNNFCGDGPDGGPGWGKNCGPWNNFCRGPMWQGKSKKKCGPWNDFCHQDSRNCGPWNDFCHQGGGMQGGGMKGGGMQNGGNTGATGCINGKGSAGQDCRGKKEGGGTTTGGKGTTTGPVDQPDGTATNASAAAFYCQIQLNQQLLRWDAATNDVYCH